MSVLECDYARELLPDLAAGRLRGSESADLDAHLAVCEECRAELELARLLIASRRQAPEGLARRVESALRADRRPRYRPAWGLAAAAVAALALGIGISSEGPDSGELAVPGYAYGGEENLWLGDDGLIAGAPALDELSDEALAQLLDELSVGGSGGAA